MSVTLKDALQRDNASLVNIHKSTVDFVCKCGKSHTKPQKAICLTSGAFCKECTQRNTAIKKIKNKIILNNLLLQRGLEKDKLT
jgi:hypothetical protein